MIKHSYISAILLLFVFTISVNATSVNNDKIFNITDDLTCGDIFMDSGGAGNYPAGANETIVIYPIVANDFVTVNFTSFDVEDSWDGLLVYDGPDDTYPLIDSSSFGTHPACPSGAWTGNGPYKATTFTSTEPTTGALTFVFTSDNSGANAGWEANIVCTIPDPPANDNCIDAIPLTIGVSPSDNPIDGTVFGATSDIETATCGMDGNGVWYSVVVRSDGIVKLETAADSTGDMGFDSVIEAFSGSCGSLTSIACDDNSAGTNDFSKLELSGLTPGETIFIRVWENAGDEVEPFSIAAYNPAIASVINEDIISFEAFPNPCTSDLNIVAKESISSIKIMNILGQEMMNFSPSSLASKLDMTNLVSGTYFVKVQIGNAVSILKVLKK